MPKARPKRAVGEIMSDMEDLLFELHIDHDMQHGEVLYGINGWQKIHVPSQMEPFIDGTKPMMHPMLGIMYGHKSVFANVIAELNRRKPRDPKA